MIHAAIIQQWSGVDACFNGTTIELFIVEFHLARSIQDRLWTLLCTFHIAYTVFEGCRNDGDACSLWVAVGCVRCSELGDKCLFHFIFPLLNDHSKICYIQ